MSINSEGLRESAVFNLSNAVTMVVDDSAFSLELTTDALLGFSIQTRWSCHSAAEAQDILKDSPIDLLVVDCEMPGMDGYELVRWLRHSGLEPNAFVPVIMIASHVRKSKVAAARDCGANFLVTKPFSATGLLQRIIWVARDTRPFLEAGGYKGPDRRIKPSQPLDEGERRADMLRLKEHLAETEASKEEAVA